MFGFKAKKAESFAQQFQDIRKEYLFTPDINTLEQKSSWLLFIYDEFMRGRQEHGDFLSTSDGRVQPEFRGECFTNFDRFVMYNHHSGPVVLARTASMKTKESALYMKDPPGRIKGELYLLQGHDLLLELDRVKENGVMFKRLRINVVLPYQSVTLNKDGWPETEEKVEVYRAWWYIGLRRYWDTVLDCGYETKSVSRFTQNINRQPFARYLMGDYYHYTLLDVPPPF